MIEYIYCSIYITAAKLLYTSTNNNNSMAEIKLSEARIIVFLEKVKNGNRYASLISAKLDMDYGYCMHIIKKMHAKGWLTIQQFAVKKYYFLTKFAPLDEAKKKIIEG